VSRAEPSERPIRLQAGEAAVLSLARRLAIEDVLVDEALAKTAGRLFGLKPLGTVFVLMGALELGELSLNGFFEALSQLVGHGFRLKEEVYSLKLFESLSMPSADCLPFKLECASCFVSWSVFLLALLWCSRHVRVQAAAKSLCRFFLARFRREVVYARYPLKVSGRWLTPMEYYTREKARVVIDNTKFVLDMVRTHSERTVR